VWGQAVTAYIVANDPATGDDVVASVDRRLRGCLAKYKVPKAYHRVDRLP
jgi:acyl-CoA synthetase (AMP-forming)/AMP-acid ligase II